LKVNYKYKLAQSPKWINYSNYVEGAGYQLEQYFLPIEEKAIAWLLNQ